MAANCSCFFYFPSRYHQSGYDASHPTPPKYYQETYRHLESPEKVNSLERNKKAYLQSHINNLDQATYGGTNSYGQNDYAPSSHSLYTQGTPTYTPKFETSTPTYTPKFETGTPSHYASVNRGYGGQNRGYDSQVGGYDSLKYEPTDYFSKPDTRQYSDGYSSSEYVTNSFKTPDGYKTHSYKYESYQSTPQPTYSTSSEKYYTSAPALQSPLDKKTFETFKNGGDTQYQSAYSTNVEYINEPPVFKDDDTLEQKMLKKSVTQQIIEKKTVQTTKSSKQESSTKTFRFE